MDGNDQLIERYLAASECHILRVNRSWKLLTWTVFEVSCFLFSNAAPIAIVPVNNRLPRDVFVQLLFAFISDSTFFLSFFLQAQQTAVFGKQAPMSPQYISLYISLAAPQGKRANYPDDEHGKRSEDWFSWAMVEIHKMTPICKWTRLLAVVCCHIWDMWVTSVL